MPLGFQVEGLDIRHKCSLFFEVNTEDVFGYLTNLTVTRGCKLKLHHLLQILQQRVVDIQRRLIDNCSKELIGLG